MSKSRFQSENEVEDNRVKDALGLKHGRPVQFTFNGEELTGYEGETVATALLASGYRDFRLTFYEGESRGLFCGMGSCFDCLVVVDGQPSARACMTRVRDGMTVARQIGNGDAGELP